MKTFRLFSMAALALVMAACSSEDNALENATPVKPGLIPFSATVAPLSGATTRTVYTPGTDGESKPIINVAWKEGDQIYITRLSPDFGTAGTVTVGEPNGDGSAPLSGNISGTDGSEIEAQYPASAASDWLTFTEKYNAQDGTLSGIQDNLDYRKGTGEISVIGGKATLADKLQMKSQIAIWKLTLQNTSGASLNATKVTIKDGSDIIAATTDISATSEVYMAVPFNTSPTTFDNLTIEATTADGIYTYAAPIAVNLSHSTYYQSTVKMAKAAPSYDKEMNLSTTSSDVTVPEGEHWLIKGYAQDICVTIGNGATVTLNGVEFFMDDSKPCIKCSGDATIIIADETTNTLTASGSYSGGIQAGPTGKTLTIKGNTGVLTVAIDHTTDAAAIGAYDGTACGDIVIEGGVINATSQNGAAIGACYKAPCGNITISGGTVTAKAGGADDCSGVGIGGHYDTACGNIKITGGTVTATGFNEPGIGGDNLCGDITISGGTVKATKGEYADMCIGLSSDYGTCGTITIGGTVYWNGSNYQNDGDTYLTQDQIIYPAP